MKVMMEFDDEYECRVAFISLSLAAVITDLDQWLRDECKYKDLSNLKWTSYDGVRDKLRELLDNSDISLESLL